MSSPGQAGANEGNSGLPLAREPSISLHSDQPGAASGDQLPVSSPEPTGDFQEDYSLSPDQLVEEPETVNGIFNLLGARLAGGRGMMGSEQIEEMPEKLKELRPYGLTLGFCDVDSCLKLDEMAAGPDQASSHEKISYYLSKAGELSLGMFTSADPASPHRSAATAETALPIDSTVPSRKRVLLAQVIATKTENHVIMDEDCMLPPAEGAAKPTKFQGHNEAGRTLAIQSLAVLPAFQGRGLGRVLLRAYLQRMAGAEIADRIAVLADPEHAGFYEKLGFENKGTSSAKRANGKQVDMVMELADADTKSDEL